MATFQYARKDGSLGTIQAPDAKTALKMLPADAAPSSGVMGGLSGTGTPAPGGTPELPTGTGSPTPQPSDLPSDTTSNPLLNFKNAIAKIDEMARQNRNQFAGSLAGAVPAGTLNASSFGDIVQMLNKGGSKYASETAANALDTQKSSPSDIFTSTNDAGVITARDKTTGAVLWKSAPGEGNVQGGAGGGGVLTRSGALTYTKADYSEDASALEQSRGTDGWVDPTIYQKLYDAWVAGGGKIADFVKTYPPAQYVNPENDWLPTYLRPKSSGVSNPFAIQ